MVVQGLAAGHVLHDDEADVFLHPGVVDRGDVRVAQHARHLCLIEEQLAVARPPVFVLQCFGQCNLDGDIPAGERIVSQIDDAHAAPTDLLDDVVLAEGAILQIEHG